MIVIKTSQNIIQRSKAHSFLTTQIVNRVSLILIVWLSPRKKKESLRYNQFSLHALRYRCYLIFYWLSLTFVFFSWIFWQISRKRQRNRLWLQDTTSHGLEFWAWWKKTTTPHIQLMNFNSLSPIFLRWFSVSISIPNKGEFDNKLWWWNNANSCLDNFCKTSRNRSRRGAKEKNQVVKIPNWLTFFDDSLWLDIFSNDVSFCDEISSNIFHRFWSQLLKCPGVFNWTKNSFASPHDNNKKPTRGEIMI